MSRAIIEYFDRMRAVFPRRSHFRIDDMQESFVRQTQHAKNHICFSLSVEDGDVPYLYLVYQNGKVRVFVTIYAIYCGEFALFDAFPHGSLYDYPYDARPHRKHIAFIFCIKRLLRLVGGKRSAPPLVMFGMIQNLGHHIWQECVGLVCARDLGLLPENAMWFSHGCDYLNIMSAFAIKAGKLGSSSGKLGKYLVWDGPMLRFAGLVIPDSARQQLLSLLQLDAFGTPPRPRFCLQIRLTSRRWLSQRAGLRIVLKTLLQAYPNCEIFIDGHAKTAVDADAMQPVITDERRFFCALTAGLASTRIRSLIGLRLQEKLPLYASCDLIIGPIGSGNVIPGWLLKVPSIVYGPAWLCRIAMKQEREVPQGGPFADFVPAGKMKSVGDEDYDFSGMEIMKVLRSRLRIGA